MLFEDGNKIIGIVKTARPSRFSDGNTLPQKLLGFLHLPGCDIAVDCHAGALFEQMAHHRGAAVASVGNVLNGQLLIKTCVDHRKHMAIQIVIMGL